ncbi:MAG: hypothetical protein KGL39_23235 [Patescibacteria group bacterium]|nr:hypothetical protein [Patescibacteria group bacterium]
MNELRHWVSLLLRACCVHDVEQVLQGFSEQPWTLLDRATISAIYTPIAVKMLGQSEEKYRRLEDLAALCWRVV